MGLFEGDGNKSGLAATSLLIPIKVPGGAKVVATVGESVAQQVLRQGEQAVETIAADATRLGTAGAVPESAFQHTAEVVVEGRRAIDKSKSYENVVRGMYDNASFAQREYFATVDGKVVRGIADDVTDIGGKSTAVEAKFVDDWNGSLRNADSANGTKYWAVSEQEKMLEQAKKYASGFDGGVVYHTNSIDLANYYTKIFEAAGIKKFKFIITPTK